MYDAMVKLVHEIPRSTFTYPVEGFFAANHQSLRNQVSSRYPGFFRGLLNSPSKEIRFLVNIVKNDPRSTICTNLKYLEKITQLNQPQFFISARVRAALPVKQVPEAEKWRLGLIISLKKVKDERFLRVEDTKHICATIDSLCST